jgi:lysozyme family protein
MIGAGASLAGLALPVLARAQPLGPNPQASDIFGKLLGAPVADPLRAVLPAEAFEAAELASSLIDLERRAKGERLPPSPLSRGEAPLGAGLDRIYELAMPRLVALIDRAEQRSPQLADRAGELLARLHTAQYVTPDWLTSLARPGRTTGRLMIDPGADEGGGGDLPVLALPEAVGTVAEAPPPPAPEKLPPVSRSFRFASIAGEYEAWFRAAEIKPDHADKAQWHLTMMRQSKGRYDGISRRTGVPWYFIAAVHALEASFNFRAHLHNGDFPLSRRTRQVPAGRPSIWLPPSDWENSAVDALRLMGFAGASDWSLPRLLYRIEAYNGFGYRRMGRATPYLWSFSTLYERGKFVADGRFDPNARSQQCGAAVMLKVLADAGEIDLG